MLYSKCYIRMPNKWLTEMFVFWWTFQFFLSVVNALWKSFFVEFCLKSWPYYNDLYLQFLCPAKNPQIKCVIQNLWSQMLSALYFFFWNTCRDVCTSQNSRPKILKPVQFAQLNFHYKNRYLVCYFQQHYSGNLNALKN